MKLHRSKGIDLSRISPRFHAGCISSPGQPSCMHDRPAGFYGSAQLSSRLEAMRSADTVEGICEGSPCHPRYVLGTI